MASVRCYVLLCGTFLAATTLSVFAKGPQDPTGSVPCTDSVHTPALEGMSGRIRVIPNTQRKLTTVVFLSSSQLNPASNQIVFVLQSEEPIGFPAWSGSGRLLVGCGVLIVLPAEDDSSHAGWMYKFAGKTLAAPTSAWPLKSAEVYGIARYGEVRPLTEKEITNLAATGQISLAWK
jgi:hypothetical protein